MTRTSLKLTVGVIVILGLAGIGRAASAEQTQGSTATAENPDRMGGRRTGLEVLEWNHIFIDTLIATNTANSSSRRLRAIVHTAIFDAYNGIGRKTGSTRTEDQTALAAFWEGNASVHWNQAANQIALANHLSLSDSNRLLAVLNVAMADTAFTTWSAKRFYGAVPTEVTWRPVTSIPLAESDGNPDTAPDPDWLPLINTPSHPEYPAGHPSLNGAAASDAVGERIANDVNRNSMQRLRGGR